ncbi:hypothetical protein ABB37_02257 [Leptomonas pyrrhocoris]|uniref:Uncharacterized protein n=1 Tax=Leptomonas pyrrhocoris TaxID=157538 RepID=A0A0M9G7K7_LEPPY|nr:hypothetical protein ABB37_02257 [Leptomonas pyrrhocoris]KPA84197.1 hypothetical protein ABB37_02257 [Leptomonas pyrrhocoris]|eukprot:XP_015662636.1 hypothetical protein ABB37_02257 [Leptomonas pyrrhocoris]
MLYFLGIVLLTFTSTFMVADTVAHIWQALNKNRVALLSYGVWMAAFTLSVVDVDWLTTLGFAHALFFIGCWMFARPSDTQLLPQLDDYVRIPFSVYVPAYFALYFLQSWLW